MCESEKEEKKRRRIPTSSNGSTVAAEIDHDEMTTAGAFFLE